MEKSFVLIIGVSLYSVTLYNNNEGEPITWSEQLPLICILVRTFTKTISFLIDFGVNLGHHVKFHELVSKRYRPENGSFDGLITFPFLSSYFVLWMCAHTE